jgi:cytosine/adenosine deaminase-related metal-dependent hydrolase
VPPPPTLATPAPRRAEAAQRAAVVARVLRTADELERLARRPAAAPRLALATRGGAVALHGTDSVLLGRGARCDVVLASRHASREHAVLLRRGGAWWVEDLDSANGTYVDGARVTLRRLADGDVLVLADEPVRVTLR